MVFGNKKRSEKSPRYTEEEIQNEIRNRILKESNKRKGKESAEEATQATLDALENMVSLSREEMEQIAEQVKTEFKKKESQANQETTGQWIFPSLAIGLIGLSFFLVRRGPPWYLFFGLILLFVCLNHFLKKPPPK
jgi:hypothetical protein